MDYPIRVLGPASISSGSQSDLYTGKTATFGSETLGNDNKVTDGTVIDIHDTDDGENPAPNSNGFYSYLNLAKFKGYSNSFYFDVYIGGIFVAETVKISDTDTTVNGVATKYCAHDKKGTPETTTATGNYGCEIGLPIYDDHYYAVKVRVVGNTNPTGTNMNSGLPVTPQ